MQVIAFITEEEVIERILRHLRLWDPSRPSPVVRPARERTVLYDEDVPVYEEIDEPP